MASAQPVVRQFRASYDFFSRHPWLDRWRYLVLLSSSRISYREMALLNVAFCRGQLGDGLGSEELYRRALEEFPESELARSSLRMFDAAKRAAETGR